MGVFAEFERSMIRERIMAALMRAKASGKALGRPKVDADTETAIVPLSSPAWGCTLLARSTGLACRQCSAYVTS